MKQKFFLFSLVSCLVYHPSFAQEEALRSLVDAEWEFINLARETNTRDAFWAQFTDQTILFGEGPVNAKKSYENQKPNASWLKWEPIFSDIAASGDFGYNTGPWEFRPTKTDENAVAFGQFVSMWRKQEDGRWKLLLDIGIDHPKPSSVPTWKTSSLELARKKNGEVDTRVALPKLEQDFINAQMKNKPGAYKESLSAEVRLYRPGKEPMTESLTVASYLEKEPVVQYHFIDGGMAASADLAYAYGTAVVHLTTSQTKAANYLRIWKNEKDRGWRIVLDLVTYR